MGLGVERTKPEEEDGARKSRETKPITRTPRDYG